MSMGESANMFFGAGSIISGLGTGASSYAAYQEAQAANRAADYNAASELMNAEYYDAMAKQATAVGKKEADDLRREGKLIVGKQRVGYAASGVKVDDGSALDATMDTAREVEYDAQTILYNADVERYGYEQKAANSRLSSEMIRNTKRDPKLAAGSVVLNGMTSAISRYGNW